MPVVAGRSEVAPGARTRAALALNGGIALALCALWLSMAARGMFWRSDFSAFYTGWSMVLEGKGARLYDLELQAEHQRRLLPERGPTEGVLAYNYPPTTVMPAALLALLPLSTAFYVWALFQLALLLPLAWFLHRLAEDWDRRAFAVLLMTVLAFPPLFMTFQMGQWSLVCLVCLAGFACNYKEGRAFGTALCLVLGTVKPQLMVVPALLLVGGRRWRELGLAVGLFALWVGATTAVLGMSCWAGFLGVVRHSAEQFGQYGIDPERMYNLKGFLTALLGAESGSLINALTAASLLLVAVVVLWQAPGRKDACTDLRLALLLLLGLVLSPHFNPVDASALVVPAVLGYAHVRRRGGGERVATLLVAAPLLFLIDCYAPWAWPGGVRPFFVLMVAALLGMGWALGAERRSSNSTGALPDARVPLPA